MAKPKKEEVKADVSTVASLMDYIMGDFEVNEPEFSKETKLLEDVSFQHVPGVYIPIPQLQNVFVETGGRIPYGSFVQVEGWQSSGKTTFSWLTLMAELIQNPLSVAHFNDVERSGFGYTMSRAFGVDRKRCAVTQPSSAETALAATVRFLRGVAEYRKRPEIEALPEEKKPHAVCVIDSVAGLKPGAFMAGNDVSQKGQLAALSALLADVLPKIKMYAAEAGAIVIWIVQYRSKFTLMPPRSWIDVTGGNALKFWVDSIIALGLKEKLEVQGIEVGSRTSIKCKKNKFGAGQREVEVVFGWGNGPFDLGVDLFNEIMQFAIQNGTLVKSGSWYKFVYKDPDKPISFQGLVSFKNILVKDMEVLNWFMDKTNLRNYEAVILQKADDYKLKNKDKFTDNDITSNTSDASEIPTAKQMDCGDFVSEDVLSAMDVDAPVKGASGAPSSKSMKADARA